MQIIIENDAGSKFDFDYEELITSVITGALDYVKCPYEAVVEVNLTTDEDIHSINKEYRKIDKATDVLSFPMLEFNTPGDFDFLDEDMAIDCFDPDTGELVLGDIIISVERMEAQAREYGHSVRRELGFLVAHSMFHLFGYDHMEDGEREEMERLQGDLLNILKITRDESFDTSLKSENEELINIATLAKDKAYAPYSNFRVGAALLAKSGRIYTGCNIENISYGATICAERTAAVKAVSEGEREFVKLAIMSDLDDFTYPCGICRQFLSEFAKDLTVILGNKNGEVLEIPFETLMPDTFTFRKC